MIKKARTKFILLSLTSIFVLLSVLLVGMNYLNYRMVVKNADEILMLLSQHKGRFPMDGEQGFPGLPPHMSPELPYESRYFSISFSENGKVLSVETSKIASVDKTKAVAMAETALKDGSKSGFVGKYRFAVQTEGLETMIVFLDHGRKLEDFHKFFMSSLLIGGIGFLLVTLVIVFFAGKIIRPITESYEKQKRFITDAGHEIKTPLTIINANIDLLEMELGKNENLDEVRLQSQRLTTLTNELVLLARMEEADRKLQMIEFPVSEITEEVVSSFKSLLIAQEKCVHINVTPMLAVRGDVKAYERLVSVLFDNAVKYSPKGGNISVSLSKHARGVLLTVENDTADKIDQKSFEHIFERFYRIDSSRNSETGGHGIGLSLAYAIVTAHGGKITPFSKEENSFGVSVYLP